MSTKLLNLVLWICFVSLVSVVVWYCLGASGALGSEAYEQELKERHSRRLAIAAQKGEQRRARLALRKEMQLFYPPLQTTSPCTPWGTPCAYPIERGINSCNYSEFFWLYNRPCFW